MSISSKSSLHWIVSQLKEEKYILCFTTEILAEYAEIIERFMGSLASASFMRFLINLPNIEQINTYYNFRLLADEDDNKFVDCAIAANASFIVSHDKDFKPLAKIDFPKVEVINTTQFKKELGL